MNFLKIVAYLRKHAIASAFTAFLVGPATWGLVSSIHADQFAALHGHINLLKETVAVKDQALTQALKDAALYKDISELRATRSTDHSTRYDPSPNADQIVKVLQ